MHSDSSGKARQLLPLYLAAYALWIGFSALGVWLIFALRSAFVDLAFWLRFDPWQVRAVDNFGVVTLGLIWLIGILLLEHHLRQGVVKQRLWARAVRVFVVLAALLGLAYGMQILLS
jgi:hypothetical protein